MVIREISGLSVTETASDSMLKPRRANRPDTRARTPGWFSTSTVIVCCCCSCAMIELLIRGIILLVLVIDLLHHCFSRPAGRSAEGQFRRVRSVPDQMLGNVCRRATP